MKNDPEWLYLSKWHKLTDFLQMSSLGLLFLGILVLESLSKDQARTFVWYFAAFVFVWATAAFIVARKTAKIQDKYFKDQVERYKNVGTIKE